MLLKPSLDVFEKVAVMARYFRRLGLHESYDQFYRKLYNYLMVSTNQKRAKNKRLLEFNLAGKGFENCCQKADAELFEEFYEVVYFRTVRQIAVFQGFLEELIELKNSTDSINLSLVGMSVLIDYYEYQGYIVPDYLILRKIRDYEK